MTPILTMLILSFGLIAFGQNKTENKYVDSDSKFLLIISTFNHAQKIYEGTLTYILTDNNLSIERRPMFSEKDTTLFFKKIDNTSLEQIKSIRLDKLKDFYFNECVMITSGNEYFVSTTFDNITKTIHLHHYYDRQIEILINELNLQLPDSLKIRYLTSDTKQDCR